MKKFYFLLIFTVVNLFSVISQPSKELRPFTNYGLCYQGLKSPDGKIIWPADFESLEKMWDCRSTYNEQKFFWIAEKNGSLGLIDSEGKLMLPFIYSKIHIDQTWIYASDENDVSIFTHTGELNQKAENYNWLFDTPQGFITKRGETYGFIDHELNEILAPTFDVAQFQIIQHSDEGIPEIRSDRFIELQQNNQTGIYDLESLKMVIPFTDSHIGSDWVTTCPESDVIFSIYEESRGTRSIVNSSGKQIIEVSENVYFHLELVPIDSCGIQSIQLGYWSDSMKMNVIDLKKGVSSADYPELFPLKGYSIFYNNKEWGVLDPSLNECGRHHYTKYEKKLMGQLSRTPHARAYERTMLLFETYFHTDIDSLLITRNTNPPKKNEIQESDLYGLINFRSGKRIDANYSYIGIGHFEQQDYAWVYKNRYFSPEYIEEISQLDIYNSSLTLVKSFKKSVILEQVGGNSNRDRLIIFNNSKMGVINMRGDEIIPIEFSDCSRLEIFHHQKNKNETLFSAGNDGVYYLYDFDGKLITSETYVTIRGEHEIIRAEREDKLYDIYGASGQVILNGVTDARMANHLDRFGNQLEFNAYAMNPELTRHCYYFLKDKSLYKYHDDTLEILDENDFDFTENYCFFLQWVLIDRTGKIITRDPRGLPTSRIVTSPKLSVYPIPIPETKPNQQSITAQTVPTKQFEWRQKDINKPNEWYLYNGNGLLLYSESFEYPLSDESFGGGIFRQNGKFGYFDNQYNIQLPAVYDFMYRSSSLLTLKDGNWQLHNLKVEKESESYDNISIHWRHKLHFVFKNGKIGLIDDSLNLVVPLTDSIEFLEKYDLVKLLNYQGQSSMKMQHELSGIVFNGKPVEVYRKINNAHILEQAYLYSTANHLLNFSPVNAFRSGLPDAVRNIEFHHNATQQFVDRVPTYYNQYFYSEKKMTWERNWYGDYDYTYLEDRYKVLELFNYKIVGDKLVEISLTDILKSDAQSTKKLHELMIRELNEIQAFGANCTDIESKLELLKTNFVIGGYQIVFHWPERGGFSIALTFTELKSIFVSPEKMLVL